MTSTFEIRKICQYCKEEFTAKTTVTRFCSHKCSQRAYKERKRAEKTSNSNKDVNYHRILDRTQLDLEALKTKAYLSIKEAYVYLGISESTLFRLIRNGTLKSTKLDRRTLIERLEIDLFLQFIAKLAIRTFFCMTKIAQNLQTAQKYDWPHKTRGCPLGTASYFYYLRIINCNTIDYNSKNRDNYL